MLPFNIEYYKPKSIEEAVEIFFLLKRDHKRALYYSGGTEILTLGRLNLLHFDAVIDIKSVKECLVFDFYQNRLVSGAALPLTLIEEMNLFPLLSTVAKGVADHTARNKITIGGNLCGQIFYREAVLPFLLCDSDVVIAGENGIETRSIHEVFNGTFQLEEGQFVIQLLTEQAYTTMPFASLKKRQQWETGYPLLTVSSIKVENRHRFAFSGLCPFPFRSAEMEDALNQTNIPLENRIQQALESIPDQVLDDIEGSREYRLFVLRNTLEEIITELEGEK
ncbi:FAD binding domain-containing protein [Robertmurraya massiliosenegalensis]|uniref:FAD binding domain-containing protein n=1 Tax=Robertmurraya TaxID=2837507 RepID=UPI0039A60A55